MLTVVTGAARADWTWVNPLPSGNTYNGIAASGSGNLAVSGEAGLILEKTGDEWIIAYSAGNRQIYDLDLEGEFGIAAGENNTVLLRDGDGWWSYPPPSTSWFYGADVLPGGSVWICGDLGKIYNYDGMNWTEYSSGTTTTFKDIEMVNENLGWAVGLFGTVRMFNGNSWQFVNGQTSRFLRSVSAYSGDAAWVVGDLGTILFWDGLQFNVETPLSSATLHDVLAVSETEAWAVGNTGTVLHCTAGVWNMESYPELGEGAILSITMAEDGTLWIAGADGFLAYLDGNLWIPVTDDFTGARTDIFDVEYHPVQDKMYLAGERGNMWVSSPDGFIPFTSGTLADINRMLIEPDGTFWLAGSEGMIRRDSGSGWMTLIPGTTDDFHDIYVSDDTAWAAGGHSDGSCVSWTAAYYDGSEWTVYSDSGT